MTDDAASQTVGSLRVDWRISADALHVSWSGRLDQSSADSVQRCLEPAMARARDIVVDCAQLTLISSLGIRVLILLHKHAKSRGGSLSLTSLQPQVRDVLEFAGMNRVLGLQGAAAVPGR